jgi:hypothetical protein
VRSHSKVLLLVSVLTALAAALPIGPGSSGVAGAQRPASTTATPTRMSGSFVLAEARSTAEARVNDAIEEAVNHMSFFIRGIGRGRLRETNDVPERVDIQVTGDHVVVRYDGDAYEGDLGVERQIVARGKQTQMTIRRNESRLSLLFRSDDGEKLQLHTFSDDGREMSFDVRVTSDQLPSPLTYRIAYRRS